MAMGATQAWYVIARRLTFQQASDAIGNVTSRSDVGSYTYHGTRKHAVVAAGSSSYDYDANGNLVTRNGAALTWPSAKLRAKILRCRALRRQQSRHRSVFELLAVSSHFLASLSPPDYQLLSKRQLF